MRPSRAGSLIRPMSSAMPRPSSGVEPPARVLKRIAALGHHVAAWAAALDALRSRLEKGRLPVAWRDHLRAGLPLSAAIGDSISLTLRVPDSDPADWRIEPRVPESLPALSAGARALLHLPVLRKSWAAWLRHSTLEDLRHRLGRAWIVDPAPLPPHGALPGLGLARWGDFLRLSGSGRRFRILLPDAAPLTLDSLSDPADWAGAAGRLGRCNLGGALVEELPVGSGTLFQAEFVQSGGRWQMASLIP